MGRASSFCANQNRNPLQHAYGNGDPRQKQFRVDESLHHHIFSADVRQIKPEPAIYQTCLQIIGVQPSETLFVDDRDANLVTARAAGIRGIRFRSVEQLRSDLPSLGFSSVLPRPTSSQPPR
jgi:FMN phosphatase YigB (HAD superfamily)